MKFPKLSRLVGDDHATIVKEEHVEAAEQIYRSRMEKLGYKLSEVDSYQTETVFFAEDAFEIPTDISKTTEVWMSRKTRSSLPFIDTPKSKILSDAGKDIGSFSESAIGKITLLGKRMEHTGRTFCEGLFHLASWIQDLNIGLIFRKEFVYFPRFLVQTGKPMLFGSKENFCSFVRMHRCGRLTSHYADIMETALRPSISGGNKYIVQSFFTHSAKDENIRIVERKFDFEKFEQHQVLKHESVKGFVPFLVGRLQSKLISESEIVAKLAEWETLLGPNSLSKPSRLTVDNLSRGQQPLSDELLAEFTDRWKGNSKVLRLRHEERYYDRKAIEESLGGLHPLRVGNLLKPLPLSERAELLVLEHDREVEKLYQWVLTNPSRLDDVPRALIRDDPVLCLSDKYLSMERLLIVSDDYKLVNAATHLRGFNWRLNRPTYHITVNDWVLSDLTATPVFEPDEVFMDEGALDGYLDILDASGKDPPDPDGKTIANRYRLVRPTRKFHLPQEVMEIQHLRAKLPTVGEESDSD
jgi:hypothetical protein